MIHTKFGQELTIHSLSKRKPCAIGRPAARENKKKKKGSQKKRVEKKGNSRNLIGRSRKVCHPSPWCWSRPETRRSRGRQHSRVAIRRRVAKASLKVEPQHLGCRCGRRGSEKCSKSKKVNRKHVLFLRQVLFVTKK
jgi:hypothetical protein